MFKIFLTAANIYKQECSNENKNVITISGSYWLSLKCDGAVTQNWMFRYPELSNKPRENPTFYTRTWPEPKPDPTFWYFCIENPRENPNFFNTRTWEMVPEPNFFYPTTSLNPKLIDSVWDPGGRRGGGASSLMLYSLGWCPRSWRTASIECLRRFFQDVKLRSDVWGHHIHQLLLVSCGCWVFEADPASSSSTSQWSRRPSLWQSLEDERKWLKKKWTHH